MGKYITRVLTLAWYHAIVGDMIANNPDYTFIQINREDNAKADDLSKLVQSGSERGTSVYFEELMIPSIDQGEILCINSNSNWITLFTKYLEKGILPEDKGKAKYLKNKASCFILEDGQLYRRTFSALTLKCVNPKEADYCLREVHEGICGDQLVVKALNYKIIRQGYYWPTIHSDVIEFVK